MDYKVKDIFLLDGIIEACDDIKELMDQFGNTEADLRKNKAFQFSCAFALVQIGEYAGDLSARFVNSHPEIPWRDIVSMRNTLTHSYGKSCVPIIWQTISEDIVPLRSFCVQQIKMQ